nr:MAG TPA: hypothetical protein [Caudoviricetes sp.]
MVLRIYMVLAMIGQFLEYMEQFLHLIIIKMQLVRYSRILLIQL